MTYIVKPSFLILSVFFKLMGCFLCIFIMFFLGGEEDEVVPNLPSEIAAKSPFHPSRAIFLLRLNGFTPPPAPRSES